MTSKSASRRAPRPAPTSPIRASCSTRAAHCAKKLGEEAVETALAAIGEDRERLIGEAADLIYHLLVLLEARGVALAEAGAALAARTRQSGLDEKASRSRGHVPALPGKRKINLEEKASRSRGHVPALPGKRKINLEEKASRSRGHVPALPGKRKIKTRPG